MLTRKNYNLCTDLNRAILSIFTQKKVQLCYSQVSVCREGLTHPMTMHLIPRKCAQDGFARLKKWKLLSVNVNISWSSNKLEAIAVVKYQ